MLLADPDRIDNDRNLYDDLADPAATALEDEARACDGSICSHCKKVLPEKQATVCPYCGYYAALGICIDVDERWEQLARGVDPAADQAQAGSQPKSHLQVWIDLVPAWGWLLLGCNLSVLVLSVIVRFMLPGGAFRTVWSVTQLLAGIAAFAACHFFVYLKAIADDASLNILDVLLRPIRLWKETLQSLPKTLRLTAGGSCGLMAIVGSTLIIGALPYKMLLDWGIEPPPKQNLLGAIAAQAQKVEGEDQGLEDAIGDFAGAAGEFEPQAFAGKAKEKNVLIDCLVVGYTVHPKNSSEITSLLVAREFQGQLKYIGRLSEGLNEYVRFELSEEMAAIPSNRPFVSVPPQVTAFWVQPKFTCRVKCVRETESGSLIEMELDKMLGKIN